MDPAWITEKYFTMAEMDIIKTHQAPVLPELPNELSKYLLSYVGKVRLLLSSLIFVD